MRTKGKNQVSEQNTLEEGDQKVKRAKLDTKTHRVLWTWTLKGFCPQVSPQPLWVAPGVANVRKLQELTYHLLHAGLWEELRQEVIGNQRCPQNNR